MSVTLFIKTITEKHRALYWQFCTFLVCVAQHHKLSCSCQDYVQNYQETIETRSINNNVSILSVQ